MSPSARLLLNRRLIQAPIDAVDYVITHELCHIWQGQHRALHMSWKHVTTRYRSNPYELEARRAVEATRATT